MSLPFSGGVDLLHFLIVLHRSFESNLRGFQPMGRKSLQCSLRLFLPHFLLGFPTSVMLICFYGALSLMHSSLYSSFLTHLIKQTLDWAGVVLSPDKCAEDFTISSNLQHCFCLRLLDSFHALSWELNQCSGGLKFALSFRVWYIYAVILGRSVHEKPGFSNSPGQNRWIKAVHLESVF